MNSSRWVLVEWIRRLSCERERGGRQDKGARRTPKPRRAGMKLPDLIHTLYVMLKVYIFLAAGYLRWQVCRSNHAPRSTLHLVAAFRCITTNIAFSSRKSNNGVVQGAVCAGKSLLPASCCSRGEQLSAPTRLVRATKHAEAPDIYENFMMTPITYSSRIMPRGPRPNEHAQWVSAHAPSSSHTACHMVGTKQP